MNLLRARLLAISGLIMMWAMQACAAEETPYAWYRGDAGISSYRGILNAWKNQAAIPGQPRHDLTRTEGNPQVVRVRIPSGEASIIRLTGHSAIWSTVGSWGNLKEDRTIIFRLRLRGNQDGFLFDGSTGAGMSRAQIRGKSWQVGTQSPPVEKASLADKNTLPRTQEEWHVHGFFYHPSNGKTEISHRIGNETVASVVCDGEIPQGGLVLGANAKVEQGLSVDIAEVLVYPRLLSQEEYVSVSARLDKKWKSIEELPSLSDAPDPLQDPAITRSIVRKQGEEGIHTYRIPGLATSTKGTLLAVFDNRHKADGDLPADIDVGLRRSTDNGATWGPLQTILDFDKNVPDSQGNGVGDPAILVDRETGEIFVTALWSKGARGWFGSGPGLSPEETGQLVITRSKDDGVTWSAPINITEMTKQPEWRLFFQGPGSGIQLKGGQLVFAAQFKGADNVPHSCLLWSNDHGATWQVSSPAIPATPATSESQVAELSDGSLLLTMRNEAREGKRLWAKYTWKETLSDGQWSAPWHDVPDPTCMASLIRHPSGALIFSNPASSARRVAMTVRVSEDDGKTWSAGRLIDARPSSYSCLTVLKNGEIGLLYECGNKHAVETLSFARFSLEWLKSTPEPTATSSIQLAPIFSDHMVLPSGIPVPIWGTGTAGSKLTLSFGDQVLETNVDTEGEWSVTLKPLAVAKTPKAICIRASQDDQLTISDVLVGDVWLAAGQSNMDWPVQRSAEVDNVLRNANQPEIRLLRRKGLPSSSIVYSSDVISQLEPGRYFVGEWQTASPEAVSQFSAVAWSFAKKIHDERDVPTGIIDLSIGGTPTEAWIPESSLKSHPTLRSLVHGNWLENPSCEPWCQERAKLNLSGAVKRGEKIPSSDLGPHHCYQPGYLWKAGVEPLVPFPAKGVLWYQGESNAERPERVAQHAELFPALVSSWRDQWKHRDLPIYFVQLPGMNRPNWPEFRDQQRRFLKTIPNIYMAVTIDLGEEKNVHPKKKQAVGERLASLALINSYGIVGVEQSPLIKTVELKADHLHLEFDHSKGLKTTDGLQPVGFEIAGSDGIYQAATSQIVDDSIRIAIPDGLKPVQLRYGGQPFPLPPLNLVNAAELPASPFIIRVDEFNN